MCLVLCCCFMCFVHHGVSGVLKGCVVLCRAARALLYMLGGVLCWVLLCFVLFRTVLSSLKPGELLWVLWCLVRHVKSS